MRKEYEAKPDPHTEIEALKAENQKLKEDVDAMAAAIERGLKE